MYLDDKAAKRLIYQAELSEIIKKAKAAKRARTNKKRLVCKDKKAISLISNGKL